MSEDLEYNVRVIFNERIVGKIYNHDIGSWELLTETTDGPVSPIVVIGNTTTRQCGYYMVSEGPHGVQLSAVQESGLRLYNVLGIEDLD